jgi:hypothetical protein
VLVEIRSSVLNQSPQLPNKTRTLLPQSATLVSAYPLALLSGSYFGGDVGGMDDVSLNAKRLCQTATGKIERSWIEQFAAQSWLDVCAHTPPRQRRCREILISIEIKNKKIQAI